MEGEGWRRGGRGGRNRAGGSVNAMMMKTQKGQDCVRVAGCMEPGGRVPGEGARRDKAEVRCVNAKSKHGRLVCVRVRVRHQMEGGEGREHSRVGGRNVCVCVCVCVCSRVIE